VQSVTFPGISGHLQRNRHLEQPMDFQSIVVELTKRHRGKTYSVVSVPPLCALCFYSSIPFNSINQSATCLLAKAAPKEEAKRFWAQNKIP